MNSKMDQRIYRVLLATILSFVSVSLANASVEFQEKAAFREQLFHATLSPLVENAPEKWALDLLDRTPTAKGMAKP